MKKHVNGDVRVIGMVHSTHVLEDIAMDVPYGETVLIPAEKALRSIDLWRAIESKCVFRIPAVLAGQAPPRGPDPEKVQLERRVQELEAKLAQLESDNSVLRNVEQPPQPPVAAMDTSSLESKLDSILAAMQSNVAAAPMGRTSKPKDEVVDGSAPTFLPSQIASKDLEARIDIQGEKSESGVSSAADQLRKLRKRS